MSTMLVSRQHIMPFGSQLLPDGRVRFRLWAPQAQQVRLWLNGQADQTLNPVEEGWFELVTDQAGVGSRYQFQVDGGLRVPDPASRYQPEDVHGPSEVVDPAAFDWGKSVWRGRPWEETVLYELHVGTFTPEGTFNAVQERLDYLVELGVTTIELMPVADFPGRWGWGYDGVLLYAPESRYGRPEDLKTLVRAAHERGLMVFLDVVYNHFGPEGNYLHVYAESFFNPAHQTPWGAAINFDGPNNRTVRDFFIHNALFWLSEYQFDGLRFDAVHAIMDGSSTHILDEIAQAVRNHPALQGRHIHLVLENDDNRTRYLSPGLYNAQWNDDYHHAAHIMLSGEKHGYYEDYHRDTSAKSSAEHLGRCLAEGFAYQGEVSRFRDGIRRGEPSAALPPTAFVNFLQNHDQVGNRAFGGRLSRLSQPEALRALVAVTLLAPTIPLLFMGEEWAAETPFLFFCDLGPDLAPLVSEGRRKEFSKFPEFVHPEQRARIPDPVAESTFADSRLRWEESQQPEHRAWQDYYRHLLALRRQVITPLLGKIGGRAGRYEVLHGQVLCVSWSMGAGAQQLDLLANLSDQPVTLDPALGPTADQILFESPAGLVAKWTTDRQLPPWAVLWSHAK